MAGFTAINAPAVRAQDGARTTVDRNVRPEIQVSADANPANEGKTVASDYLGRGNPDATVAQVEEASGLQPSSGVKKPSSSAKRRASTVTKQKNAKRQKTKDVAADMPITKAVAKADKTFAAKSTSSDTVGETNSAASHSSNVSFVTAPEQPEQPRATFISALHPQPQMVSVVSPSTSMTSLHSSSPQTSLDAIRSSKHSANLYNGQKGRAHVFSDVRPPHILLQQVNSTESEANERTPRSRKECSATSTDITNGGEQRSATNTQRGPTPQPTRKAQRSVTRRSSRSTTKAMLANSSLQKSTASTRTLSEDCNGENEDHGIAGTLIPADTTRTEPETGPKWKASSTNNAQASCVAKSDTASQFTAKNNSRVERRATPILGPEEEFMHLCDENEDGLGEPTEGLIEHDFGQLPIPTHRDKRLNLREVDPHEDYGGALLSDTDRQLLAHLKSSQSQTTDNPVILRKPFAPPILDRSPIFGATNTTTLRTCFRLGEALNVGSNAVRTNSNVILELYARVSESWREGRKQFFVFRDLYHDNPPYLEGTFELWGQSVLWDLDSRAFLGEEKKQDGLMCRLIGKMKKDVEKGGVGKVKYRLEVLNIWEASWEDVDYVAGIYARE